MLSVCVCSHCACTCTNQSVNHIHRALNNARHKLLADVFYGGSPGGGSVVENTGAGENYQLESLELTGCVCVCVCAAVGPGITSHKQSSCLNVTPVMHHIQ